MSELTPSEFNRLMEKAIRTALSKARLKKLGDKAVKELISRVKQGFGSSDGGKRKLKGLSANYIEQRKKLRLDASTGPTISNLTQSGDMLKSIEVKTSFAEINIDVDSSNSNKAEYVSKVRPFLDLTKDEADRLTKAIDKEIAKEISKLFK